MDVNELEFFIKVYDFKGLNQRFFDMLKHDIKDF